MSKLHGDEPGYEEVRFERGELRKPDDRHDQPGQGAVLTPPNDGYPRDAVHDARACSRAEPGEGCVHMDDPVG